MRSLLQAEPHFCAVKHKNMHQFILAAIGEGRTIVQKMFFIIIINTIARSTGIIVLENKRVTPIFNHIQEKTIHC